MTRRGGWIAAALAILGTGLAGMAAGQDTFTEDIFNPEGDGGFFTEPRPTEEAERTASASAATLRGLDKVTGVVRDLEVSRGETVRLGRLEVTLGDCRYPAANPAGNAYAWLSIREAGVEEPAFLGWMVAAAPALNALEHARYDVWVLGCVV